MCGCSIAFNQRAVAPPPQQALSSAIRKRQRDPSVKRPRHHNAGVRAAHHPCAQRQRCDTNCHNTKSGPISSPASATHAVRLGKQVGAELVLANTRQNACVGGAKGEQSKVGQAMLRNSGTKTSSGDRHRPWSQLRPLTSDVHYEVLMARWRPHHACQHMAVQTQAAHTSVRPTSGAGPACASRPRVARCIQSWHLILRNDVVNQPQDDVHGTTRH